MSDPTDPYSISAWSPELVKECEMVKLVLDFFVYEVMAKLEPRYTAPRLEEDPTTTSQ